MEEILVMASIIAPITVGLVQAVKKSFKLDRALPLIAIVIGMLLGGLATFFVDADVSARLWAGGISGLASVGLFEVGKNAIAQEGTDNIYD